MRARTEARRITYRETHLGAGEDKVTDVVGVFLTPSERAFALCLDESSQLQAVDRASQAVVFTGRRPELIAHGGRRNSTTTLFAALEVLTGSSFTSMTTAAARRLDQRHRYEDFLRFLATLDESVPQHLAVHLVMDNCITHQHADVQRWLDRHHRFHLLFAPHSDSWLGLAEQWLRGLCDTAPRGSFNSVPALIAAIEADSSGTEPVVAQRTTAPTGSSGFVWTASARTILAGVRGGQRTLAVAVGQ